MTAPGISAFHNRLERDSDGSVLRFLNQEVPKLEGKRRGGIAYVLAEHHRQMGNLKSLQQLNADDDAEVKASVLNALWGQPDLNPDMGPGIVQLAIDGPNHPDIQRNPRTPGRTGKHELSRQAGRQRLK